MVGHMGHHVLWVLMEVRRLAGAKDTLSQSCFLSRVRPWEGQGSRKVGKDSGNFVEVRGRGGGLGSVSKARPAASPLEKGP